MPPVLHTTAYRATPPWRRALLLLALLSPLVQAGQPPSPPDEGLPPQVQAAAAPVAASAQERQIGIGRATEHLLDLQRGSPGLRPRPIAGEQASRSYQRYLKSFETDIPALYGTGIDVKGTR